MAPDIAAGGGAAEVATKDFGAIAGLYEANNANALRASEATAANATHAAIAGAQIANQSSMEADRLGEQRRQFDQSRGVSERDNWMANVQAHAQQQHAQLQAWVQGQELSQAEQIRTQRLQNSVGTIEGMRQSGQIDDQTADDMLVQVKTGLDPLLQRQQASKQKMMEEQHAAMMHQNAAAETMQQQDQAFAAGNFDSLPLVTDPETGKKHRMLRDKNGKWYDPFEARHAGKDQPEVDDTGVTYEKHQAMRAKAVAAANAFIANAEKPGPDGNAPPKGTPEDRIEMQKKFMDEMYGRQLDWKPANRIAPQGGPGNAPPTPGQPGAAPDASPAPQPPKSMPDMKPEDVQKTSDSMREKAKAATWLPEDKRKELVGLIDERAKIIADYRGKVTPPAVWQRYDQITAALQGIPSKPPPDPRKRPVPPTRQPDWLERNIVNPADRFLQGFPGAGAGVPGPGPS